MLDQNDPLVSRKFPAPCRVVFAGPLPPPGHGMANVNQDMVARIAQHTTVTVLGVQPPTLRRGLVYHLIKAKRALIASVGVLRARITGAVVFYGSVDDGFGGLWTLLFTSVARLAGMKIFLHHHSYKYILQRTRVMRTLVFVAGPRAVHVMLCDEMTSDFSSIYPRAKNFLAAPNAVARPARLMATRKQEAPGVTIGLMSNLTQEKGLTAFIRLVEEYSNPNLRGILAGPIPDPEDEALVRKAMTRLDGRLEWLGPVSGEAKEAFFEQLDLFVFPTTYKTESFGLVLLEALVRGVPCIAPKRGCICVFEKLSSVDVVPLSVDFADAARQAIAHLLDDTADIAAVKAKAQQEGEQLNRMHEIAQEVLASQICRGHESMRRLP